MEENQKKLFDSSSQFILFSGTCLQGNGAFRHLNDLFFVLYTLVSKGVEFKNGFVLAEKSKNRKN